MDGDTDSPTDPIIDIGGALTGRKIGADLGFERPVSALYIYTDRSAGDGPVWQIYASNDNLDWRLVSASPGSTFNPALNRYELLFDSVETRYIKAVKGGVGDIDPVHVTEIEALETLFSVRALHVTSGGVGIGAATVSILIEGEEAAVRDAFALVESLRDEPDVELAGRA